MCQLLNKTLEYQKQDANLLLVNTLNLEIKKSLSPNLKLQF